jgi:Ser/Thr protein kinase RdoA (MazF antagonist)
VVNVGTSIPLSPDLVLPQRDRLLDADEMRERLADRLGASGPMMIDGCALIRAKYRIGESLRVVYRLDLDGTQRLVAARAFAKGRSAAAYEKAGAVSEHAVPAGRAGRVGGLRTVVHDRDLDAVWWVFPRDRKLVGLDDVVRPTADVRAALGLPPWVGREVAEYAPERSATFRALDSAGAVISYVKAYAPGTADVVALAGRYNGVAAALERGRYARSPRGIGIAADRHLLALEAMPGAHWNARADGDLLATMRRIGQAIAAVHAIPTPGGSSWIDSLRRFPRLAAPRVLRSADLVATARPDVGALITSIARELCQTPPVDPDVVLHGDCHPKNALVDGISIALVDLDQAGIGAAAADIGSLLARLRHDCLQAGDERSFRGQASAFLDGYGSVCPLPSEESIRWHTAAALVAERAMRAVNRVQPEALRCLDALVVAAESTLRRGALA